MRRLTLRAAVGVLLLGLVFVGDSAITVRAQNASPAICPITTPAQNADLVRRWYIDVYNGRNTGLIPALLAPNYIRHRPGAQVPNQPGTADDIQFVKLVLTEFPDLHVTVDDMVAAGDQVAVRTTFAGTQRAPLTDQGGAPATGRRMSRDNIAIWRVTCGRLSEQWIVSDFLTELRQLGIITNDELKTISAPSTATPVAIPSPAATPLPVITPAASPVAASPTASCPTTTPEENAALIQRRYKEVWNGRDLSLVDGFLADNVVFHRPGRPQLNPPVRLPANASDVQRIEAWFEAFPDLHITIEDVVAAGNEVAVRATWSGTQRGPLKDLGVPATGRPAQWQGIAIFRIACGQIAEQWIANDDLTMLRQIGAISADELKTVGPPDIATPTS